MKITEMQIKGYKNLIDCTIPLGDFNVIVGPNNSGKSNLLEFFRLMLYSVLLLEKDDETNVLFHGKFFGREGSSIPHGKQHTNLPLTMAVSFEVPIKDKNWRFHYEMTIHRNQDEKKVKISREILTGKRIGTTGPDQIFFQRENSLLKTTRPQREFKIAERTGSFAAIRIHYPDLEATQLSENVKQAYFCMLNLFLTTIYSLYPTALRKALKNDTISEADDSFSVANILQTIDKLNLKPNSRSQKLYQLFKESACDILDLDDLNFQTTLIPSAPTESTSEKKPERLLQCFVKRPGADYVNISECSDGTLMVLAILAGVLSDETDSLICIEEPENCLHPAALEKLIKFLKEQSADKQILLTTHSPYLLNSVSPEDVIVALPDENAATVFRKPKDIKKINKLLKSGFFSLGDLLVDNFAEVL